MNFMRLRNGRHRAALLVVAALGTFLLVLVMHDTHSKLVNVRSRAEDCEQKQDSLSAQLQVAFENKVRLEKGLQQEKLSHKQTKDKLESLYEELQESFEKEKLLSASKYNTLQQQYKSLQEKSDSQKLALDEEINKLRQTNAELQEEHSVEIGKLNTQVEELKTIKDKEISELQGTIALLQSQIKQQSSISETVKQLQSELLGCKMLVTNLNNVSGQLVSVSSNKNQAPSSSGLSSVGINNLQQRQTAANNKNGLSHPSVNMNSSSITKSNLSSLPGIVNSSGSQKEKEVKLPDVVPIPHQGESNDDNKLKLGNDKLKFENDIDHQLIPPKLENHPPEESNNIPDIVDHHEKQQLDIPNIDVPKGANVQVNPSLVRKVPDLIDEQEDGAGIGREVELVHNGLEQQENGEDEDLDNMENDKKEHNQQIDADFDEADQEDNDINHVADKVKNNVFHGAH